MIETLPSRRWSLWNFGLRGMVAIVAGLAALLAAWRYYQENIDADRAVFTIQRRNLDSPDPRVRVLASYALSGTRSEDARRAVAALTGVLNDPDATVRAAAAESLGPLFGRRATRADLDADVPEVGEALIRSFEDPDPAVRRAAVRSLFATALPRPMAVGPGAIPPSDPDPTPEVGPDPARAIPALKARLLDDDAQVRYEALAALAGMIPDDGEARRFLLAVLRDNPSPTERVSVLKLLWFTGDGWRGDPEVVRALARALNDPAPGVRATAGYLLTSAQVLPPDARSEVADRLGEIAGDAEIDGMDPAFARWRLAQILIQFAADDPATLRPLLRDRDPAIRSMARGALGLPDAMDADDEAGPGIVEESAP